MVLPPYTLLWPAISARGGAVLGSEGPKGLGLCGFAIVWLKVPETKASEALLSSSRRLGDQEGDATLRICSRTSRKTWPCDALRCFVKWKVCIWG